MVPAEYHEIDKIFTMYYIFLSVLFFSIIRTIQIQNT